MVKKAMTSKRLKKDLAEFYKEISGPWTSCGMSESQLAIILSATCNCKMTDMVKVLKCLKQIAIEELLNTRNFTIPGIVQITAKIAHGEESKGQLTIKAIQKFEAAAQGSQKNVNAFAMLLWKNDAEQKP